MVEENKQQEKNGKRCKEKQRTQFHPELHLNALTIPIFRGLLRFKSVFSQLAAY